MTRNTSPTGQMLRLAPGKQDLVKRTPIVLTDRDRDILSALFTQGFLTTELVELVFFSDSAEGRHSPSSRAYERLRQLWSWRLVERIEIPTLRSLGGRRPFLYTLGPRGVPVVAEQLQQGVGLVQRRRVDRLRTTFLDHELTVASFWAHLVALLHSSKAMLQCWIPEREIRARKVRVYDRRTQRLIPVLPDAVFLVRYPDNFVQTCYLEVDMGTLTVGRYQQKLRAFEDEEGRWLGADRTAVDFEVCVLTRSRQRLNQLWRATRETVDGNRWSWYSFATLDLLQPQRFRDTSWVSAENEFVSLLHNQAFVETSIEEGAQQ